MRIEWRLPQPLLPGRFLRRANRFAAEVIVEDRVRYVHLPNSGRLRELLHAGAPVRVHPTGYGRTWGTLLLVRHGRQWVSIDSHLPNRLWEAALHAGGLPPIRRVRSWEREISLGEERIDFRLQLDARADPELAQAGREAADAGVLLCAYLCSITLRRVAITKAVPVDVPPASERRLKP
jgi:sugar fermentation stimulation protein A